MLGFNWLDDNKPQPKERPYKVKKIKVFVHESNQISQPLIGYSQGQVLPKDYLELKSEVAGKISYLSPNFVNGGVITKGEVLVQLEDQDYKLTVIQRRAKVAQNEQLLAKAKAETNAAQRELKQLGRENASELALGIPQLKQAEAALESAQAELAQAELDLTRTTITAPFNARIESENLTVGQYINRAGLLVKLFSTEVMEVRLALSTQEISQIGIPLAYYSNFDESVFSVNLSAQIGNDTIVWPAKIVRTESVIDDKTRSVYAVAQVRNSYLNQSRPLLKGLFVNAEIIGNMENDISILPKESLRSNQLIWTVDKDNRLNIITANIIQRTPDSIIVKDLPKGSLVITSALAIPTPGMPVLPIKMGTSEVIRGNKKRSEANLSAMQKDRKKSDKGLKQSMTGEKGKPNAI